MDLELIAKMLESKNLGERETILISMKRIQHIPFETGESSKLMKENPQRFINVGSRTVYRDEFKSTEDYQKTCMSNAAYLYEKFPLVFEFYDELMNGIIQEEKLTKKAKNIIKSKNYRKR